MASLNSNSTLPMTTIQLCGTSIGPCGYCSGRRAHLTHFSAPNCSQAYGVVCSSMSPDLYETLLNRGWRRSGTHIYKPNNWNSCCPALSIRLDTTKFQPTKSQKQVVTKLERALNGNVTSKKQEQKRRNQPIKIKDEILQELENITWQCLRNIVPVEQQSLLSPELCRFKVKTYNNKDSASSVTLVCMACPALDGKSKGVLKRNELAQQLVTALQALDNISVPILSFSTHESSGQVFATISSNDALFVDHDTDEMSVSSLHPTNPVQEWLQTQKEPPYQLTITTLPAHESSLQPDVHKLYFAYQQAIHGDPDPLQTEYSDEDDEEEDWGDASLDYIESCKKMISKEYSNPQDTVKMNAAFSGFYRFLVESPLAFDGTHGTVHQHYRIDGKLIAVGVVDILPNGLSSVYAIYDPSQHVTAFGKYMSLREIQYAMPRFYYLGFYIESCPKMRYKAEYHPSELLCPTWLKWVDAAKAKEILKKESPQRHCCTLYKEENGGSDANGENGSKKRQATSTTEIVNQVRLDVGASTLVTLKMLQGSGQAVVQPILESFVEEMGPELSRQFILKLV